MSWFDVLICTAFIIIFFRYVIIPIFGLIVSMSIKDNVDRMERDFWGGKR